MDQRIYPKPRIALLLSALQLSPGQEWERLVFSGGLLQKIPLLRKFISDKFGAAYRLSPSPEDALNGLLVLALAFNGRAGSVEHAMDCVGKKCKKNIDCSWNWC